MSAKTSTSARTSPRTSPRTRAPTAAVRRWRGEAAVGLSAGDVQVVFLPELGMLGASLRFRGEEYLSLHGGVVAHRSGRTNALPQLAPWANRLSTRRFRAAGVDVDHDGVPLIDGGRGLPIHGTMLARDGWEILRVGAADRGAALRARFDYGAPTRISSRRSPSRTCSSSMRWSTGARGA